MDTIRPPRLNKGDVIGIVTPASPVADPTKIDKGVRYLEGLGYRVKTGNNVGKQRGYLAGNDEERIADLHAMFGDKSVKAIFSIRGGYGTPRLLGSLDYRLIRRNPKILVGYSDITALQLAIWKKCGLITFHGPMVGVEMANAMDAFTEEMFWQTLTSRRRIGRIRFPDEIEMLGGGKASGRLLGGNLALLVSLLGTPYEPDLKRSMLFLEDVTEEPYRVDRLLAQLRNASILTNSAAMLIGQFTDCVPLDPTKPSLNTGEIIREYLTATKRPVLSNLPFGHVPQKMTIPIGLQVAVNADKGTLDYLEAAVA